MDTQILSLYAKGIITINLLYFSYIYINDISPSLIFKVTDTVKEQVIGWQNRLLDSTYPILYLDYIAIKVW